MARGATRRTWVKLFITGWLHGSIRWQLEADERSVWADIICMAGECGQGGLIADNDGRPLPWSFIANRLNIPEELLERTIAKCKHEGRLEDRDDETLKITNWSAYQSEYERQKPHRKKKLNPSIKAIAIDTEIGNDLTPKEAMPDEDNLTPIQGDLAPKEANTKDNKDTVQKTLHKRHIRAHAPQSPDKFNIFWQAYPKKKSKGQAEKAFAKINPDEQFLATMLAAIEQAKKSGDWLKEDGKYIPYPATWLNAKGWEDEYKEGTVENCASSEVDIRDFVDKEGHLIGLGRTIKDVQIDDFWEEVRDLMELEKGKEGA